MNANTWIELAALVLGGGGGGSVIAKLTRLVVAVESLTDKVEKGAKDVTAVTSQVQDHEKRLNRARI